MAVNTPPHWFTEPGLVAVVARGGTLPNLRLVAADPNSIHSSFTISYTINGNLPQGLTLDQSEYQTLSNLGITTLPPGLSPNSSARVVRLTGTVTAAPGLYTFAVRATDVAPSGGQALWEERTFQIRVLDTPPIENLPQAAVGRPYSFALGNSAQDPVVWSIAPNSTASLPAGLTLSSEGVISGTPVPQPDRRGDVSSSRITFRATLQSDPALTFDVERGMAVNTPPHWFTEPGLVAVVARGGTLPNLRLVAADPNSIHSSSTIGYTINGNLPQGLTLDQSEYRRLSELEITTLPPGLSPTSFARVARLVGTVTAAPGLYTFTVRATDVAPSGGQALWEERTFQIRVLDTPPIENLPQAAVGRPYSFNLGNSAENPVNWSVVSGTLPSGLTLSSSGVISGTPLPQPDRSSSSNMITFRATLQSNPALTFDVERGMAVNTPPHWFTEPGLVAVVARGGTLPNLRLVAADPQNASNSTPTYQVTGGALPPGLTINSNNWDTLSALGITTVPPGLSSNSQTRFVRLAGSVSPTAAPGIYTFTVRATDTAPSGGQALWEERTFSIEVQ
jgi:hypothetical protein